MRRVHRASPSIQISKWKPVLVSASGARVMSNSGDFFSVILKRERSEPRRRRPRRLGRAPSRA
ncbi:MAG: hypothetical protein WB806_08900, partial [Xanthobacteraceae bacterium]